MTKVAIIGAGVMARQHICAFSELPGVSVIGIHSRTREKAQALATEYQIPHVCDTLEDLYSRTQADLIVLALSEEAMKSVALACMSFPGTLLLEKPPGLTPQETRDLLAASIAQKRRVFVGLNRRFYSTTQAALHDLADSDIPRYIHVQDQQSQDAGARAGFPVPVVANWMYKNSIHLIDYLCVFGRGTITGVTPILRWNPKTSQVVLVKVDFSSGDIGIYEGIWRGPGPWAVSISTEKKRWEMRPLEEAQYQISGERQRHTFEVADVDKRFKAGIYLQAQQAIAAVRGESSEIPTLADALKTMKLVEAIFA